MTLKAIAIDSFESDLSLNFLGRDVSLLPPLLSHLHPGPLFQDLQLQVFFCQLTRNAMVNSHDQNNHSLVCRDGGAVGISGAGGIAGHVNASPTATYLHHMGAFLRSTKLAKRSMKEDLLLAKLPAKPTVVVVQRLLQCAPTKTALSNVAQLMDHLSGLSVRDSEALMAYFDRRMQELNELAAPQHEKEKSQ